MVVMTFHCESDEISCLVGNLFVGIEPPCEYPSESALTLCGTTHSGRYGRLTIKKGCCVFYGEREDLEAVRNGKCLDRRCKRG